jgi:hypothetical protein
MNNPKDVFILKVLKKLGFTEKELLITDDIVSVKKDKEIEIGSYSTKAQLFIDAYWKIQRLTLTELDPNEERAIANISLDMLDKDTVEVVRLNIDF